MYLPYWCFGGRSTGGAWVQDHSSLHVYAGVRIPRPLTALAQLHAQLEGAEPYDVKEHIHPNFFAGLPELNTPAEAFTLLEAGAWALAQQGFAAATSGSALTDVVSRRVLFPCVIVNCSVATCGFTAYVNGRTGAVWGTAQQPLGARLFRTLRRVLPATEMLHYLNPKSLGALGSALGALLEVLARASPALVKGLLLAGSAGLQLSLRLVVFPPLWIGAASLLGHSLLAPILAQRAFERAWAAALQEERARQRGQKDEWRFREGGGGGRPRAAPRAGEQPPQGQQGQQRSASSARGGGSSAGSSSGSSGSRQGKAPPYVAAGDHHAVLGLPRFMSVSEEGLAAAYKRELQVFHPDHAEAGGWDPALASERTRQIIDAYQALKKARREGRQ